MIDSREGSRLGLQDRDGPKLGEESGLESTDPLLAPTVGLMRWWYV